MNFLFHSEKQFTFNRLHLTANRYMNVNSKFLVFRCCVHTWEWISHVQQTSFLLPCISFACILMKLWKNFLRFSDVVPIQSICFHVVELHCWIFYCLVSFPISFENICKKNIFSHFLDGVTIQSKAVCIRICIQTASF